MKILILILIIITFSLDNIQAQNTTDGLIIHNTRRTNENPSFFNQVLRADFKLRDAISVPGWGNYSTSLTISPWIDRSGDAVHQVNFNDGGIYHRTGYHDNPLWNQWNKVLTINDNGFLELSYKDEVILGENLRDYFIYDEKKMSHYALKWGYDSWGMGGHTLWQSGYSGIKFFTTGLMRLAIHANGNVGIGTENPQSKLDVAGTIRAREVKIEVTAGADHVFAKEYNLKPLSEVEEFVRENKHLPEIPSERQMQEEGLSVNEFQIKLLQKIEELTLYTIQLEKRVQELEK